MKTKKKKNNKHSKKKKIVVAVSGGFDPIHIGHVRLMQEAKRLGDKLIVILNNDNWFSVKGKNNFMTENDRREIIEALACVDEVYITKHEKGTKDISVCEALLEIKPDVFANGGDRKPDWDPVPEVAVCEKLGIKMVYNVGYGGKVRSSSDLLKEYSKRLKKK
jgi:D-beta-D-heptose 7-phosphate kinase/D-beta-D-heptose 1-phosphate adenosyltransferase